MNRDELKQSGLLDQYVLGLLGPERNSEVEQLMEEDPFLAQEVERLRKELNSYVDSYDIAPPPSGRGPRTAQEFQDLDHEMITAMVERNHSLNLWRYVLLAVCLVLIGLSGYLFRLKEGHRGDLVTEQALRAQDHASHQLELRRRSAAALQVSDDSMSTHRFRFHNAEIRTYFLPWAGIALLDLNDVPRPAAGHDYYLFPASEREMGTLPEVIHADDSERWRTVQLTENQDRIRIYDWDMAAHTEPKYSDQPDLVILLP